MPKPTGKINTHRVGKADDGQRLDRLLKRICPTVPFIGLQKAIRTGAVRINGRKAAPDARVQAGDEVLLPLMEPATEKSLPYTASAADLKQLKAMIVFEDKQLLVLNKPQGLASQAGGGITKSLDRVLVAAYGVARAPKLVHRLDKETSGLMVCAKNRTTAAALGAQWAGRDVAKAYIALVQSKDLPAKGEFKEPLLKVGPISRVADNGDKAHTSWVRLAEIEDTIWAVLVYPRTGRMNQIRAHFAHHNAALVGDDKYGPFAENKAVAKRLGTGLALHAWRVRIAHPFTGAPMMLEAPLPYHLHTLLTHTPNALELAAQAWQVWAKEKE